MDGNDRIFPSTYPGTPRGGFAVDVRINPYSDIHTNDLHEIISHAVAARAREIEQRYTWREYLAGSMAWVILDESAPPGDESDAFIMAIAWAGPSGGMFIAHAAVNALADRDHEVKHGAHLYVGGAGMPGPDNHYQCAMLAAHIEVRLAMARPVASDQQCRCSDTLAEPGELARLIAASAMAGIVVRDNVLRLAQPGGPEPGVKKKNRVKARRPDLEVGRADLGQF